MSNTALNAARWKLYGLPLSQPFRSVAWLLLQNQVKFDIELVVPGADNKMGSRHENYKSKSRMRTTKIPLLEDTRSGTTIAESPAILSYLCEHYGWQESFYGPSGSTRKATIDSYMHSHHTSTRKLSQLAFPYLRGGKASHSEELKESTLQVLQDLEDGWFTEVTNDAFLVGGRNPTIADLLCYEEIVQNSLLGLIQEQEIPPKILDWMHRMEQLPFYQQVHLALTTLGDVTVETDDPIGKRLGRANKFGIEGLLKAQQDFPNGDGVHSKL